MCFYHLSDRDRESLSVLCESLGTDRALFLGRRCWPQVFAQWLNVEDDLQAAVESCPVDCIHWVERDQLPVLEHVMSTMDRVGVASMQAGQVCAFCLLPYGARPFAIVFITQAITAVCL